jgi:hypothetical protein
MDTKKETREETIMKDYIYYSIECLLYIVALFLVTLLQCYDALPNSISNINRDINRL